MATRNRRETILNSTTLTGIDFVEIASDQQTALRVHFLNSVDPRGKITGIAITGGVTIPEVPVLPFSDASDWSTDTAGKWILNIAVAVPGDFSTYVMSLTSTVAPNVLDPFFRKAPFSFKARCESQIDCEPPGAPCPPRDGDRPPIDYLAKDFLSFRQALLDFSALRYPEWQERSEADFGVMFAEALSSLGDDLSYTQDRVAAEAALDTATQRRSLTRLARLVDYEMSPATIASVLLRFEVAAGLSSIPAGVLVSAPDPDGTPIFFETGQGIAEAAVTLVSSSWNSMVPYFFDDSLRCLQAGATFMYVQGHGLNLTAGQKLLIESQGLSTADPQIVELVVLDSVPFEDVDTLFGSAPVTRISWSSDTAPKKNHDLTRTVLRGNLVPATQGRRFTESFAIDVAPPGSASLAIAAVRTGPNGTQQYLYTLVNAPLAWLAVGTATIPGLRPLAEPEVLLSTTKSTATSWDWRRKLLDAPGVEPPSFTLDPVRLTRTNATPPAVMDYDGDNGYTIRFGDGVFGPIPELGSIFQVRYRVGSGAAGNVAAGSITRIEHAPAGLTKVTNPFAAAGGADAESAESVRRLAPQAFRARQFRAVRPEDYQAAAETLPWVQRAGTVFRWTGSWLTVFTTADPKDTEQIPPGRHLELIALLNRYRMAGYESYAPDPRYAALDLLITICARTDAFRGDVQTGVLNSLSTSKLSTGGSGFFHFDRFTFGVPLERSALEATIQEVPGVSGVVSIQYRRRGVVPKFEEVPLVISVARNEIILVENDPNRPERGSLRIHVLGGK